MQSEGDDRLSSDNLNLFINWPQGETQKVPSAYSYSKTSAANRCRQWGHSIDDNSMVILWTKLNLERRTTVQELGVLRELVKGLELVNKLRANQDAGIKN